MPKTFRVITRSRYVAQKVLFKGQAVRVRVKIRVKKNLTLRCSCLFLPGGKFPGGDFPNTLDDKNFTNENKHFALYEKDLYIR